MSGEMCTAGLMVIFITYIVINAMLNLRGKDI